MAGFRWSFTDPSTSETYVFLVNPNAGGSPTFKKTVTPLPLTASDGAMVLFEGRQTPPTIAWSGVILDESQYSAVVTWFGHSHQLELTDDLARVTTIYITDFTAKRAPRIHTPWRLTYDVKAILLQSALQNLLSADDSGFEGATGLGTKGTWVIIQGFTFSEPYAGWFDAGKWSLDFATPLVPRVPASPSPGPCIARETAPLPVTPGTIYRARLRYKLFPDTTVVLSGGTSTSYGRGAALNVRWSYTNASNVVTFLSSTAVAAQDSTGLIGPQTLSGVAAAPAMPAGGTNMVANIELVMTTGGAEVVMPDGSIVFEPLTYPIPTGTICIDSVQFGQ